MRDIDITGIGSRFVLPTEPMESFGGTGPGASPAGSCSANPPEPGWSASRKGELSVAGAAGGSSARRIAGPAGAGRGAAGAARSAVEASLSVSPIDVAGRNSSSGESWPAAPGSLGGGIARNVGISDGTPSTAGMADRVRPLARPERPVTEPVRSSDIMDSSSFVVANSR